MCLNIRCCIHSKQALQKVYNKLVWLDEYASLPAL